MDGTGRGGFLGWDDQCFETRLIMSGPGNPACWSLRWEAKRRLWDFGQIRSKEWDDSVSALSFCCPNADQLELGEVRLIVSGNIRDAATCRPSQSTTTFEKG